MKIVSQNGIIFLLLTVSEDKATQRCDLSAGTEVSGKGDASASLFFCINAQAHQSVTLSGNPNALNLGARGPGQSPGSG